MPEYAPSSTSISGFCTATSQDQTGYAPPKVRAQKNAGAPAGKRCDVVHEKNEKARRNRGVAIVHPWRLRAMGMPIAGGGAGGFGAESDSHQKSTGAARALAECRLAMAMVML